MKRAGKPKEPGAADDLKRGNQGEAVQYTQVRPLQQQAVRQVAASTGPEVKPRKRRKPFVL